MNGERERLRERIQAAAAEALSPWVGEDDETRDASADAVADAVLDALGLERLGVGWCPVHGEALCPEGYMLNRDGEPRADYQHHWTEDMRCGRRQPVYRLTALSGSEGAGS